jgi:hypothetical protein
MTGKITSAGINPAVRGQNMIEKNASLNREVNEFDSTNFQLL